MRILFQGDSITDAGRDYSDPLHLGDGYAFMAARMIRARFPEEDFTFYNRGVSGNRSRDLAARWQADCIDLKPDLVSILVGVNDVWRAFDEKDPTSAEQYEETVRTMLEDVRTKTGARILLMEPFVVIARPEQEEWQPDLQPKIAALRRPGAGIRGRLYPSGRPVRRRLYRPAPCLLDAGRGSSQRRRGMADRRAVCRRSGQNSSSPG